MICAFFPIFPSFLQFKSYMEFFLTIFYGKNACSFKKVKGLYEITFKVGNKLLTLSMHEKIRWMSSIILPEFCPTSTLFFMPRRIFSICRCIYRFMVICTDAISADKVICQLIFFIVKIGTLLLIAPVKNSKEFSWIFFCILFAGRHFDHDNYAPNSYLPSTCCVVVMLYLPSLFSLLSLFRSISVYLSIAFSFSIILHWPI